ncbi:MAG: cation:proton antiporter [Alistipes indistinctus]
MLVISLGLCLGMVVLATSVGFSSALGAFVMGSVLAGTSEAKAIEKVMAPVKDLFRGGFFVSVGMLVEPPLLWQYMGPILLLTLVVIAGQIFYGTIGFLISGQDLRLSLQSSFSLAQNRRVRLYYRGARAYAPV